MNNKSIIQTLRRTYTSCLLYLYTVKTSIFEVMSSVTNRGSLDVSRKKMKISHWNKGLKASMHDPDFVIESDELVVIIKDKYPKAQRHYLIMPKEDIDTLINLNKDHVPLLKHMQSKAEELIAWPDNAKSKFRIGFHAVPSMRHLHMHVISQDFNSPCLKTKDHWNSFTTEYFVDSTNIIKQVEEIGHVKAVDIDHAMNLLRQPLRCHVCKKEMKTMPELKKHIKTH